MHKRAAWIPACSPLWLTNDCQCIPPGPAGLGQYKENNGWPVAVMRRRFKCGKGETETDTERIAGDRDEEPAMGGCSVM